MDRNEFPLDPCHVGVPSVAPKMISEPMVRSVQTVYLSCVKISTTSKRTKTSFHLTHVTQAFPSVHQNDCMPMVHSVQTVHLSCVKINTISMWQNRPNYMAHVCLSLSYRLLTVAHGSQTTLIVYRVSSGNPESYFLFFQAGFIREDIAASQQFIQIYNYITSE
jgi:hypothetical protein